MESDFQVTVKGLSEESGQRAGVAITELAKILEADKGLDLSRLHRVIITSDYAGELALLSKLTTSKQPLTFTNEEYALGVAKLVNLPTAKGGREQVIVLNAGVGTWLAREADTEEAKDLFNYALHLLHHEFAHVHDNNMQFDAFGEHATKRLEGPGTMTFAVACSCWDEYNANRLSASTADEETLLSMGESLASAVKRTKPLVDAAILTYRSSWDLDALVVELHRHGDYLLKSAAYVIGYMDGREMTLEQISADAQATLPNSYFEDTFDALRDELPRLQAGYPEEWTSFESVFDRLMQITESYYSVLGFDLSTTPDGGCYVSVPYRPETMPE